MMLRALLIIASLARPDVDRAWAERVYEDTDDGRLRHAQAFVRDHAASASKEQLIVAHATIGRILWERSCPVEGGCVVERMIEKPPRSAKKRRRRKRSQVVKHCGSRMLPVVEVVPRDRARAQEAQSHLTKALALADSLSPSAPRSEVLSEAIASARLGVLEPRFEAFAPLSMSSSLEFYVDQKLPRWGAERGLQLERKKASQQALADQLQQRDKEAASLVADYERVVQMPNERLSLTAMARIGQIHAVTAYQLWRAPVPRVLQRKEERRFQYCDSVSEPAENFWAQANVAYTACLERAMDLEAVDGAALECQQWVEKVEIDRYPATHEFFGQPKYERTKMVIYGVQLEPTPAEPIVVRRGARP